MRAVHNYVHNVRANAWRGGGLRGAIAAGRFVSSSYRILETIQILSELLEITAADFPFKTIPYILGVTESVEECMHLTKRCTQHIDAH